MLSKEDLKALIEHEKQNLLFYARYHEMLKISDRELERLVDIHLDRMIELRKQLKE